MMSFTETIRLLLRYARIRSLARAAHQKKLINQRNAGRESVDWGCLGTVLGFLMFAGIHGMFAWMHNDLRNAVWEVQAAKRGLLLVGQYHLPTFEVTGARVVELRETVSGLEQRAASLTRRIASGTQSADVQSDLVEVTKRFQMAKNELDRKESTLKETLKRAAQARERRRDDRRAMEQAYQQHFAEYGTQGFTSIEQIKEGGSVPPAIPLATTLVLLWWFVMQAFQGEGLEMDFQRRRHPMWEWLLSHPLQPRAVFAAEMLSPLAANPMFLAAPVFWITLYTLQYDRGTGVLVGLAAGVPMAMAACFMSKSIEIAVMLRLAPRSRGGVLGMMSWLGYASLFAALVLINTPQLAVATAKGIDVLAGWLPMTIEVGDWLLGRGAWGMSAFVGLIMCWLLSGAVGIAAVHFSAWATKQGLAGGFGGNATAPSALSVVTSKHWLSDPLYRKELLWFWRDKAAVVQVILIPLTMASFQAFNLRGIARAMTYSWHVLAGMSVIFGTYFLFIIGPRSLVSEGKALWIPLSWPRGLEGLLKAKARLWWLLSSAVVSLGLLVSAVLFPADAWRIGAIAMGWYLFSGSLAEKSVTLVAAPSSSGEPEPVPVGRRWAAMLGTFTFATGVLSQQWAMAFAGVVYSWITSAAMWQNFRARLPYLFDSWSEKLPPPPTLMHSMIAISAMVEIATLPMMILLAAAGAEHLQFARAMAYSVVAGGTAMFMGHWLGQRGVRWSEIWRWSPRDTLPMEPLMTWRWTFGGALTLGLFGVAYSWLAMRWPEVGESFIAMRDHLQEHPSERWWLFGMAVFVAPVAEEYLFRGLLFRALDREWGGWRAMGASAAFFAIYHPPMAWVPVFALGLFNSWLFKRGQLLLPCVIVHAIYNAIIVLMA